MSTQLRREGPVLLTGDIVFLALALWATLAVRYAALPSQAIFIQHLVPFLFLFALSALVFFIAGLYEKHTLLFKSRLPETIFYAQIANIVVAALFFFFIPYFGIQPKTNLIIYLILSTGFVSIWRLFVFPLVSAQPAVPAILVGEGPETQEVVREVNGNPRYGLEIVATQGNMDRAPRSDITYLRTAELYEEIFDRVALSFVDERWFLEEGIRVKTQFYGLMKRVLDVLIAALGLVILSPLLALIWVILKLGSAGRNAFIFQKRVGERGRIVRIVKFRSMLFDDENDPEQQKKNRITAFGGFLRKTQLDEFPQFWNVLRGELSLIGPRPEIPALVASYEEAIPFYAARHLVPPGISGWAQVKHASPPKFALDVARTRAKLSYDLYYLKHRSLLLDLGIVLQTLKILLARASQ